jgi:hypothetical protein
MTKWVLGDFYLGRTVVSGAFVFIKTAMEKLNACMQLIHF